MAEVHIHRDKKKAAEFETIDYLPQDSQQYRRWLQTQPMNQQWDRWTMMFLVGVVVGLCAFFLHSCFSTLAKWKARRSQPPSAASLTCRGADEHAARHHRAQRGSWLVVQRQLLARPRRHLCWQRALALARRRGLGRARGHGVPERMPPSQGETQLCKAVSPAHPFPRCLNGRPLPSSFSHAHAAWARVCLWGRRGR